MSDYPSYEAIVEDWGFTVLDSEMFGSYQGDYVFMLADGDRRGYVVIGYGSCSGCDALEAVSGWGEGWEGDEWKRQPSIVELSGELREGVRWFDDAEAFRAGVVEALARGTDWYIYDHEARDWLARQALAMPS